MISETIEITLGFLCGLGLFLFGIHLMGDSLQTLAKERLKVLLERYTKSPMKGLLMGMLVTALIHSSSGTTAITISLVRANLMTFAQSMGVIMGANIGTTLTAFLIGLDLVIIAPVLIGLCGIAILASTNSKFVLINKTLFGFGLIFYGMNVIDLHLSQLGESERFQSLMVQFSDSPILSLLIGTFLTAIIQSSTLAIGILQHLYSNNLVSLPGAIAILLGSNIGTTLSFEILAVGRSVEAKRTYAFQVLFNIVGALFFLILLKPYVDFIQWISNSLGSSSKMTIAIAHIIFNILSTLMFIGFVKEIETLIKRIFKEK